MLSIFFSVSGVVHGRILALKNIEVFNCCFSQLYSSALCFLGGGVNTVKYLEFQLLTALVSEYCSFWACLCKQGKESPLPSCLTKLKIQ